MSDIFPFVEVKYWLGESRFTVSSFIHQRAASVMPGLVLINRGQCGFAEAVVLSVKGY